eukprot:344047_1
MAQQPPNQGQVGGQGPLPANVPPLPPLPELPIFAPQVPYNQISTKLSPQHKYDAEKTLSRPPQKETHSHVMFSSSSSPTRPDTNEIHKKKSAIFGELLPPTKRPNMPQIKSGNPIVTVSDNPPKIPDISEINSQMPNIPTIAKPVSHDPPQTEIPQHVGPLTGADQNHNPVSFTGSYPRPETASNFATMARNIQFPAPTTFGGAYMVPQQMMTICTPFPTNMFTGATQFPVWNPTHGVASLQCTLPATIPVQMNGPNRSDEFFQKKNPRDVYTPGVSCQFEFKRSQMEILKNAGIPVALEPQDTSFEAAVQNLDMMYCKPASQPFLQEQTNLKTVADFHHNAAKQELAQTPHQPSDSGGYQHFLRERFRSQRLSEGWKWRAVTHSTGRCAPAFTERNGKRITHALREWFNDEFKGSYYYDCMCNRRKMVRHRASIESHIAQLRAVFECPFCSNCFESNSLLVDHMAAHRQRPPAAAAKRSPAAAVKTPQNLKKKNKVETGKIQPKTPSFDVPRKNPEKSAEASSIPWCFSRKFPPMMVKNRRKRQWKISKFCCALCAKPFNTQRMLGLHLSHTHGQKDASVGTEVEPLAKKPCIEKT